MKNKKLKSFHIETFDGGAYLNFFTEAENNKKALRNLQKNSLDFKNLVNTDNDLTITIKQVRS